MDPQITHEMTQWLSLTAVICEWLGVGLSFVGAVLVAQGKRLAFPVYIGGNIMLAVFAQIHGHWGIFVLQFAFFVVNVMGYRNWKADAPTHLRDSRESSSAQQASE